MKQTAKIISTVFHPLIIPSIGLMIIFNTNSYINYAIPAELKRATLLLISISTFIIPLLISLLFINKRLINSLEMETRKERILPYSFTILFYIFTMFIIKKAPLPPIIFDFVIGATLSVVLAFIINFRWKISAHMIGIGGLIGALISIALLLKVYLTPFIIAGFLIAGLLGSSRLILQAHTPAQIYTGFVLGILCQFIVLYF